MSGKQKKCNLGPSVVKISASSFIHCYFFVFFKFARKKIH